MIKNTTLLLDDFAIKKPGIPFRLFQFGKLIKGGVERLITPELAAKFTLPHFKPAIKLGSHDDTTPAGGHILKLLVLDDGLYAVPEWNEQGEKAIKDGAYLYQSPEVIWSEEALEDPETGKMLKGPMIVGGALLHNPHLGEAAKLYSVEPVQKEHEIMTIETVQVPKTFWENFVTKVGATLEPKPEPEPVVITETDEYISAAKERDDYKAELEAVETQIKLDVEHQKISADLQNKETFGAVFAEQKVADESAEVLAGMSEDQRDWTLKQLKALIAQIDEGALNSEHGSNVEVDSDPAAAFNAVVTAIQTKEDVSYNKALKIAQAKHKDLFDAYNQGRKE